MPNGKSRVGLIALTLLTLPIAAFWKMSTREVRYPLELKGCIEQLKVPHRVERKEIFIKSIYEMKVTSYCS